MDYYYIGRIVQTHGIKGEVRIRSLFDKKECVFKKGMTFYIGEDYKPFQVVSYRPHKEFDMVIFEGYDNINQVLPYLKKKVYVKKSDVSLGENEYILEDLVGLEVYENGLKLGKVEEIVYNGGNILLRVSGENCFYIPNKSYFIKYVDLEKGRIITENAKGLIL